MKSYIRILNYIRKYKRRFIFGVFCSFFVSVFNGVSLTALKPIFDVVATGAEQPFQIKLEQSDVEFLCARGECPRIETLYSASLLYKNDIQWVVKARTMPLVQAADDDTWGRVKHWYLNIRLKINEKLIQYKALDVLIAVALITIPMYLLKLLANIGTVYFIASTGLMAVRDIRRELYTKMVRLPVSLFVREKTGILMSRIINDVTLVSDAISEELRISINNFFIIVTHLTILAMISPKLLLLTMFGVPLLLWPVNYFAKKIKRITTNEQSRLGDLNGHLQEVISGIRVIRAFGMEPYQAKRFEVINHSLFRETFRYRFNHALGPSLVEFTTSAIVIGLVIFGSMKIVSGEFSSGSFFLFLFTLIILMSPIKQMAAWYNVVQRASSAGSRVFEIIDMPSEIEDPKDPVQMGDIKKSIEFKKVGFNYPETEASVLKNISFSVPVGSTVALVGHSGAGKSTLVDLIPRFYDPTQGSITFDGIDIKKLKIKDLRSRIGVVTQDIFLFNGTIHENISYGREDMTQEHIESAARMAFADEFIDKLPHGYDTQIGERGLMLSGGQRQRLSIARALVKDPEILILDEATSALDTHSERLVQKALEKLMKDRTTFVIAHRLSTIYRAEQILVFDKGRIVERGTHSELLQKKGLYFHLYNMQFKNK